MERITKQDVQRAARAAGMRRSDMVLCDTVDGADQEKPAPSFRTDAILAIPDAG